MLETFAYESVGEQAYTFAVLLILEWSRPLREVVKNSHQQTHAGAVKRQFLIPRNAVGILV